MCIVNEAFVERRLGGSAAVGRTVQTWRTDVSPEEPRPCEVVGVATNAKRSADELEVPVQIYYPLSRIPIDDIYLVVRPVSRDAAALVSQVRAAIARVDTQQLVSVAEMATLDGIAHEATARYRFRALLIASFAGLALVLAALGIFGVLAYTVQRRWREYGVRMALGARPEAVVRLIARGAARLLIPGALIGTLLALVVGQLLGAMLFGVRPFDAPTFTVVLVVLAVTAALSSWGRHSAPPASIRSAHCAASERWHLFADIHSGSLRWCCSLVPAGSLVRARRTLRDRLSSRLNRSNGRRSPISRLAHARRPKRSRAAPKPIVRCTSEPAPTRASAP